jgi:hypothetical protein
MKTTVLSVLAVTLLALPAAAQVDVRLADVRRVTIETDSPDSDARPVAAYFRDRMSMLTTLTLARDRQHADAVLRFSARGDLYELDVFLADGNERYGSTQLWRGDVQLNPNYRGADDRFEITATELAKQLRGAIREVRPTYGLAGVPLE